MTRSHASYSTGTNNAFALTVEHFKTIWEALKWFAENVTCEAECHDQITRTFNEKTLNEFPNTPEKRIISMTIRCIDPKDFRRSARINLRSQGWVGLFSPISLSIDGPESELEKLKTRLHDEIVMMKPWYDRATRINFIGLFINVICFGFLILFGLVYLIAFVKGIPIPAPNMQMTPESAAVIALTFVGIGISAKLNHYRSRLFPLGVFAINDGSKRQQTMDAWRWTVIVGGVVSIAGSIIASAIWALFSK